MIAWPDELEPGSRLEHALSRPNFWCARFAHIYQAAGAPIETRAEAEQAFIIHRMVRFMASHGDEWNKAIIEELEQLQQHIELSKDPVDQQGDQP